MMPKRVQVTLSNSLVARLDDIAHASRRERDYYKIGVGSIASEIFGLLEKEHPELLDQLARLVLERQVNQKKVERRNKWASGTDEEERASNDK